MPIRVVRLGTKRSAGEGPRLAQSLPQGGDVVQGRSFQNLDPQRFDDGAGVLGDGQAEVAQLRRRWPDVADAVPVQTVGGAVSVDVEACSVVGLQPARTTVSATTVTPTAVMFFIGSRSPSHRLLAVSIARY